MWPSAVNVTGMLATARALLLELRGRLAARQASDVDSGDLDAAGDAARRPGKRQAEHDPADDEDRYDREQTLNEQPT